MGKLHPRHKVTRQHALIFRPA